MGTEVRASLVADVSVQVEQEGNDRVFRHVVAIGARWMFNLIERAHIGDDAVRHHERAILDYRAAVPQHDVAIFKIGGDGAVLTLISGGAFTPSACAQNEQGYSCKRNSVHPSNSCVLGVFAAKPKNCSSKEPVSVSQRTLRKTLRRSAARSEDGLTIPPAPMHGGDTPGDARFEAARGPGRRTR